MERNNVYSFGEKTEEENLPVFQTPKYKQAKEKAIEIIESGKYGLSAGDFWILMNKTKAKDKMLYSGLILSHNGCLKINDALPDEKKYKPSCTRELTPNGYGGSIVFVYSNEEQGIFEVGEVSAKNCTNAYPYAMVVKRLQDRVILKNCKLAFDGIYSDSESEEFQNKNAGNEKNDDADDDIFALINETEQKTIKDAALAKWGKNTPDKIQPILVKYGAAMVKDLKKMDIESVLEEIKNAD